MSGTNAAQPLIAEEATTLRRPGRALIGWMADDLGAIVLAGGRQDGGSDVSLVNRVRAARAAVAARPAGIDQDKIIDDTHSSLATITHRLRQQSNTAAFWNEGWKVGVVDLTRVCSLQQSVASQQAADRVGDVDPEDLVSLAEVTLPPPSATKLPMQPDPIRNVWIIAAANPNLRITGQFNAEVQPGVFGFGFTVGIMASFLQVAHHHSRFVLRDGYHRAYGLLARGASNA